MVKKTIVFESVARSGDADVDPVIVAWGKAGVFDEAGAKAIALSHSKGNAVTIVEDGIVYHLLPDGSKVSLRKLSHRNQRVYTSGTIYIK